VNKKERCSLDLWSVVGHEYAKQIGNLELEKLPCESCICGLAGLLLYEDCFAVMRLPGGQLIIGQAYNQKGVFQALKVAHLLATKHWSFESVQGKGVAVSETSVDPRRPATKAVLTARKHRHVLPRGSVAKATEARERTPRGSVGRILPLGPNLQLPAVEGEMSDEVDWE